MTGIWEYFKYILKYMHKLIISTDINEYNIETLNDIESY